MSRSVFHDCAGEFNPEAASRSFVQVPLYAPDVVEDAAKLAARTLGRTLLSPLTRTPWEAMHGDRSFVWRLSGTPAFVVKVCATNEPTTVRMWNRCLDLSERLRPPEGVAVPHVRLSGTKPVPWCVQECAAGSPALLATARADELFALVLEVQKIRISGFQLRSAWGIQTIVRQINGPVRDLAEAGVISQRVAAQALEVTRVHQQMARELPAVTAHNDLALYHIYMGDGPTWVIDWESVVKDQLRTLDVAHLIVSHGLARPQWASELAQLTLEHGRRELECDLTSNLMLASIERAVGKAYDMLRRRHQQSLPAVETLCAVLDGSFMPAGRLVT